MLEDIKSTFTEKPAVSAVMIGVGVVVGVVIACFTPVKNLFRNNNRRRG